MVSITRKPYHVSLWGVIVGVLVLALASASLVLGGLAQAQDVDIEYAENGKGAVATYSATDPDGSAIVSWTLDGADAGDFKIEDGVLSFKSGPDYETPKGGGQDATDTENIYEVTVQATDATKRVGTKDVTVEVTNVEEGGSMRLSAVQPQAGTRFYVIDEDDSTAAVTDIKDEDEITSSVKWQWSKSRSKTTGFADIDKATSSSYEPKDTDYGYYLRVTASYTDREGPNKSAQATSSYPVQRAPSNNAAPKFADDQDPDTDDDQAVAPRSIVENTPKGVDIGSPIEAEDLNPGKLTYTLEGTDADDFDIDRETGQLKTKSKLDADTEASYSVTVRATDPSGDPQVSTAVTTNSDTVDVTITVEDLAEDPQIVVSDADNMLGGFAENTAITTAVVTFTATPEAPATISRWSLAGPDAGKLEFDNPATGALTFKKSPDYEKPGDADGDNMYEVTVRATDSDSRTGTKAVTVEVTNVEENGTVTLSPVQHRVGVEITAKLTDPDDGVYGIMWQWSIGANAASTAQGDISGATSATYTPKAGDIGGTLTATATYRDAAGDDMANSAMLAGDDAVLRDTRNKAPVFKDSKGNTITMAERSVAENAMGNMADDDAADNVADSDGVVVNDNVGGTIMAQDPNIGAGAEGDSLAFSLSGTDASKFRIRGPADTETGATRSVQIEVKAGTKFDYETKDTYMVTLTATDDYGETADLALTIRITDVNDAPDVTGLGEVEYAENGKGAVATYSATDPDGSAIVSWTLDGADAGDFKIEDGVLSFKSGPDYETPKGGGQDATDTENIYEVTVQATDATKRVGTKDVTVEVTNVEEGGSMRLSAVQPQAGTRFYVIDEDDSTAAVTDIKDEDEITSSVKWQWSKSRSKTTGFADIDKATSSSYEPKDTDYGYYLRVTASYTDREGPNKSAQATSSYPVQRAPSNNAAPKFADDQDPDTDDDQAVAPRSIVENTPKGVDIGSPIEAEDLNPGKLTYTLEGTDADDFDIDRETGQLKTKSKLDADTEASYSVTVRATDPSGDPQVSTAVTTNSDTVDVTITVEDLAEDPQIVVSDADNMLGGFAENTAITTAVVTFTATPEAPATISRWSLAGPDAGKLEFDNPATGALTFKKSPDYEKTRGRRRRQHVRGHRPGDRFGRQDGHQGRDRRGHERRGERHRDPVAGPAPGRGGDNSEAHGPRRRRLRHHVAVEHRRQCGIDRSG